jgi:8-oxo-dGTP pyrophosphatase MutT (NUDIX family)
MGEQADDKLEWSLVGSEPGPNLKIFGTRFDTFEHPVSGEPLRATILETHPWCSVVAFTPNRDLVMVRQFRFGAREVTLEVVAGLVDEGEEHGATARRELREETGYTSERWTYLGDVYQNPASHTELCHIWLAEDVMETGGPELDDGEHIAVELMSMAEVQAAVQAGAIRHPHTITALSRVLDLRVALPGD